PSLFAHAIAYPAQVVLHIPEPATWSAQTSFDGGAYILTIFALKPSTTAPNSIKGMSIAIAKLRPTVDLSVRTHGLPIGIDTAKASIPRLYTVEPDILCCIDTVQHLALTTVMEERMQRMGNNRQ